MNKLAKHLLVLTLLTTVSTANAHKHNDNNKKVNASDQKVWISIGNDAVKLINKSYSKQFELVDIQPKQFVKQLSKINKTLSSDDAVNVVSIKESKLNQLSEFMHDNFKRCGGYIFHESLEAAQQYTAKLASLPPEVLVNYTIDNPVGVNSLLNELSSSNLTSTVNSLSNYNNRYYTSSTGKDSANWLKNHWASMSSTRNDINVELYNHTWLQPSVIATITGTTNSSEIIIIGGHLDSINLSSPSSGRAPGADDNASGIAVVTETLRAIIASGFKWSSKTSWR